MENTNEIALRSKNAEILAQRNAEFLAKYDTDDKQIDYYTNLAMDLYDEFEIDGSFTFDGVRKNVAVWYKNKSAQMQLLRKHPYWDEEAKAIVFLQTEVRGVNYSVAVNRLEELENYVWARCEPNGSHFWPSFIRYALHDFEDDEEQTGLLTKEFVDRVLYDTRNSSLPKGISRMLRVGTKITRLVHKCFEEVELYRTGEIIDATKLKDDGDPRTRQSFDKYYAKFADALSELEIERITLVSLNFLDFMTMSNGNSWSSCHFINSYGIFHEGTESSYSGMYKQGCLSYALDAPSMILYTLPTTFNGTDYYRCQKLSRMCCQYENGILVTGKCYPNNENSLITRYRQIMQSVMSQVTETPNLWVFSRKLKKVNGFVETVDGAAHYPDYTYEKQKPTISFCKGVSIEMDTTVEVGHEAYCLDCGTSLNSNNNSCLQCSDHGKSRRCLKCRKYVHHNEEIFTCDGDYFCKDCVFYCEYHNCYESIDEKFGEITMQDGKKVVCSNALWNLTKCTVCGIYFRDEDGDGCICNKCLENHIYCNLCGAVVDKEHAHIHNGVAYCHDCSDLQKHGINIIHKEEYEVGDYVLVCDHDHLVSGVVYINDKMEKYYPGKIVQIKHKAYNEYNITNLDGWDWNWGADCFVGAVINCKPEYVGKTLEEVYNIIKEENANED